MSLKSLLRLLFHLFFGTFGWILSRIIPKKKNLIIMEGVSYKRYNENPRFLFEYLSTKKELDVYWITDSDEVHHYLQSQGLKSLRGGFEKFQHLLKAGMVIGCGSRYPDFLNSVGPKTMRFCLQHGVGPKVTIYLGKAIKQLKKELKNINTFDFVNFTSQYSAMVVGKVAYKIPYDKITILGYPKNDHFFNKKRMDESAIKKEWSHSVFPTMNDNGKVLLYTPTWRNNKLAKLPLFDLSGFQLEDFYDFLEKNNIYMVYSLHPHLTLNHKFPHPHIFYLDYEKYPIVDLNNVMPEVDILLDDYSTTSTDFAILDRPQIFIMPDYDDYLNKDCFTEDYRAILPGKEAQNYEELKKMILYQFKYPSKDSKLRRKFLDKYYDVSLKNSSQLHYQFIKKILNI